MIQSSTQMRVLPMLAGPQAFGRPEGKLTPIFDLEDEAADFAILDCFDQSLRRAGKVLIESDGQLLLFAGGRVLQQTAKRRGQYVADLAPGPVRDALPEISPLRCLLRMGRGGMRRARIALIDDLEKTRARAELLLLDPETPGQGVTLANLQPIRGYDKAYDQLSNWLVGDGMDGLYIRLFPDLLSYQAKPRIEMSGEESAFQAANDIIAAYLPVARANEPGVIKDLDTEFLHDYRVALRKIRSVVSLFKGVYSEPQTVRLKSDFSELMSHTGRLRDLDVYLLDRQHYFDLLPATLHEGLGAMFDLFEQDRKAALRTLSKRFQSKAYAKEIGAIEAQFAKPKGLERGPNAGLHAHDYACALIWKRYRKVCKIASAIDDQTDDEDVHELRIHCKKLRYLMEFFAPLFPGKEVKRLIKPLKKLQDNLGLFNDYSVQQESLRGFLADHASKDQTAGMDIASSIGALIAVLHQRQLEERAKVVTSFAEFYSIDTQDRFETLFHLRGKDKT